MATARSKIVDPSITRYYHCISKCVRGAFLCGLEHRKYWLEKRLEHLASLFAVSVAGFTVMDNHLHVLVRLDPHEVDKWSDEDVIKRWLTLCPPRDLANPTAKALKAWLDQRPEYWQKAPVFRQRLADLGWFMKFLKEPLARMANREDGCTGAFWEGRYQSIAVLNTGALVTTCVYIDLNPVAAGIALTPESSQHTSVRQRVMHVQGKGKIDSLKLAMKGSIASSRALGNAEQDHWLIPFEDRRKHTNSNPSSEREGMLEKFTFGTYLDLVEQTGRAVREGKSSIQKNLQPIFERLESTAETWITRIKEMLSAKKLRGWCFSGTESTVISHPDAKQKRIFNLKVIPAN